MSLPASLDALSPRTTAAGRAAPRTESGPTGAGVGQSVRRGLGAVDTERRTQIQHLEQLFERAEMRRRERRDTPAERMLALSRALASPEDQKARGIIRREIALSVPRLGLVAFVRSHGHSKQPLTLVSALLGSGLIKRANELLGQSMVDVRVLPRLSAAYGAAARDLRHFGIEARIIRTAYDGVELGVIGDLDDAGLATIHEILERRVRQVLEGFHLALDIQLADLDFAITVGAAAIVDTTFPALLTAHMRAGGAAKAARVRGGSCSHSVDLALEILGDYRRWVESSGVTKIAGMPAVTYDPVGGRMRINLELLSAQRAGTLPLAITRRLAPVRAALNVLDWVYYQRSDRWAEDAGRAARALEWIDRLGEAEPLSPAQRDGLEAFLVEIHPRLAFVRAAAEGPWTTFVVDMKKLGPRGLSICERVARQLLERDHVGDDDLDLARIRQNDLIQDLKQVLDVAVETVRARAGEGAQIFAAKGGDDVIIGVRTRGAALPKSLRWGIAAVLATLPGVRVGSGESSGVPAQIDQDIGLLEQQVSSTLKKVERLDRPGCYFLDQNRVVTVAL